MNRVSPVLAAVALGASLLSSCSSDDDTYCDTLKASGTSYEQVQASDFSHFDADAALVEKFAKSAPEEVRDDWKVVSKVYADFVDVLAETGLTTDDLQSVSNGEAPPGLEPDALQAAMTKAEAFNSEDFMKASAAIRAHAKDECNIELDQP